MKEWCALVLLCKKCNIFSKFKGILNSLFNINNGNLSYQSCDLILYKYLKKFVL